VFQNSVAPKNSLGAEFIKFRKIQWRSQKLGRNTVDTWKEQKILKTWILAEFAELSTELSHNSTEFYHYEFMNSPHNEVYPRNL
jgi:hypothetical protein